jgi:MEMO1 family protein
MIRPPAAAGRFYPLDPRELTRQIDRLRPTGLSQQRALGCMVPHAGYIYSGQVAAAVYCSLKIPQRCILLGPRHVPPGSPMAIVRQGGWQTPLGEAQIDSMLAGELMDACSLLREDSLAHEREHSLEVQIPLLQQIAGSFLFVPIVLATDRYQSLESLGQAMAKVIQTRTEPVLVIASSDMNHYESDAITRDKDRRAIELIVALDPQGLYDTVRFEQISMCGYAATVAMLIAMVELGARKAQLIRYATSKDVTGDGDEVVGYAGITIG